MRNKLQKLLVSTVAVLTLGVITSNHSIWENLLEHGEGHKTPYTKDVSKEYIQHAQPEVDQFTMSGQLIDQAKEQSYLKFGNRIGPKISNEFDHIIFPKIEEAIHMTVDHLNVNEMRDLAMTEKPSGDYSEKIFHIYQASSGQDMIRFHVRTERRPVDGYYYNFHYHTYKDKFASHNNLGEIYWSKDTPPKWLS
ncbi:YpjP family protein [Rummeliibacillus sp. BSL5]